MIEPSGIISRLEPKLEFLIQGPSDSGVCLQKADYVTLQAQNALIYILLEKGICVLTIVYHFTVCEFDFGSNFEIIDA